MSEKEQGHSEPVWNVDEFLERVDNDQVLLRERRYGGEEFLVVLSNCNPSYAPGRAEEIRESISNRPLQTGKGPLILTMSFGVLLSSEWGRNL